MQRTKWEILLKRRDDLLEQVRTIEDDLEWAAQTPCKKVVDAEGNTEHIHCSTCGVKFETELDFMKHYLVPDERLLNLGHCPHARSDK